MARGASVVMLTILFFGWSSIALAWAPVDPCTIEVERGDTLSAIARDHTGSLARWPELGEVNPSLGEANRLVVGLRLSLPPGWLEPGACQPSPPSPSEPASANPPPTALPARWTGQGETAQWAPSGPSRPPLPFDGEAERHRAPDATEWDDFDWFRQAERVERALDQLVRYHTAAESAQWIQRTLDDELRAELSEVEDQRRLHLAEREDLYASPSAVLFRATDLAWLLRDVPKLARDEAVLEAVAARWGAFREAVEAERALWDDRSPGSPCSPAERLRWEAWFHVLDPDGDQLVLPAQVDWGLAWAGWTRLADTRAHLHARWLNQLARQAVPAHVAGEVEARLRAVQDDPVAAGLRSLTEYTEALAARHSEAAAVAASMRSQLEPGASEALRIDRFNLESALWTLEQRATRLSGRLAADAAKSDATLAQQASKVADALLDLLATVHWVDSPVDNARWSGLFWRRAVALHLDRVGRGTDDLPIYEITSTPEAYLDLAVALSDRSLEALPLPPTLRLMMADAERRVAGLIPRPVVLVLSGPRHVQVDGGAWVAVDPDGRLALELLPGPHRFTVHVEGRFFSRVVELKDVPASAGELRVREVELRIELGGPAEAVQSTPEVEGRARLVELALEPPKPRRWYGAAWGLAAMHYERWMFGVGGSARGLLWVQRERGVAGGAVGLEAGAAVLVPLEPFELGVGQWLHPVVRLTADLFAGGELGRVGLRGGVGVFADPLLSLGPFARLAVDVRTGEKRSPTVSVLGDVGVDLWPRGSLERSPFTVTVGAGVGF